MDISTPLTQDEQHLLEQHLMIIKTSFVVMVKSLATIHSLRLYRGEQGNRTWSRFCNEVLNFGERLGFYFVGAFSVLERIESYNADSDTPLPLPAREAQTRPLLSTPPDLIIPVWQNTIARYGNNPTGKQIAEMAKDVTVREALIIKGVSDADVLESLSTLADRSEHGRTVVTELLTTGYLQNGNDDAIPLADVRLIDLKRYEDEQRKEAIMRRVADEGGIHLTIYPTDPQRTAGILLSAMTSEQAYDLLSCMEYDRRGYPYDDDGNPK